MRLIWQVERFAGWCRRASEGRLHNKGDHFELPPLPNGAAATVIGFSETEKSFEFWLDTPHQSGVATLVEISTPLRGLAIQSWQTTENQILASSPWGDFIGSAKNSGIPCVWLRLKSLPVLEAWQLPRTYRELRDVLQRESFDLEETFTVVGKSIRKAGIKKPATLLIGFPLPKKFGDPARRMHWLAVQNIPISKKDRIRQEFRGTEENRQRFDQELARSTQKLDWAKCENWAPDQIRTRLRNRNQERPSILLIGAGALGSQVAETLVRMGVSEIGVQDMDLLAAGNLCRHSLDLTSIGQGKTAALVRRLNQLQPDVRAKAYRSAFPEIGPEGVIVPDSYDIVVDCTGENAVLRGLSFSPWKTEKLFISLSMTWGAQGLLVWASRGSAFPAIDAIDRLGVLAGRSRPDDLEEVIEGIGCWHPVFPADAADVQVWAGIGSRFVLDMALRRDKHCGIYHFNDDGTVGHRYG